MKKVPTSALIKAGDTLVYGDGSKVKVINMLWLNGERGIQLDAKDAFFFSERFKYLEEVENLIHINIWKVEHGTHARP